MSKDVDKNSLNVCYQKIYDGGSFDEDRTPLFMNISGWLQGQSQSILQTCIPVWAPKK